MSGWLDCARLAPYPRLTPGGRGISIISFTPLRVQCPSGGLHSQTPSKDSSWSAMKRVKGANGTKCHLAASRGLQGTVSECRVRGVTFHAADSLSAFRTQPTNPWLLPRARGTSMVHNHHSHSIEGPSQKAVSPLS